MQISQQPPIHLTYCLNVHPGETWAENFQAIRDYALPIAANVAEGQPFGLGLRLSNTAAGQLLEGEALAEFKTFLTENNLYVFTINGFVYGPFHGGPVKENVYRPDWSTPERLDYTTRLAEILAAVLPESLTGSISTSPLSFKSWGVAAEACAANLAEMARRLESLEHRTGRRVVLAIEPEPGCTLETTAETVAFFRGPLLEAAGAELTNRYLGVCFDAAHQAVEFEDLAESLDILTAANVNIAKIQLSSALVYLSRRMDAALLEPFSDEVYLHQTTVCPPVGGLKRYLDLPQATGEGEWRIHYHVPLYAKLMGELETTRDLLTGPFAERLGGGICPHLEVETYTWSLLPGGSDHQTLIDNLTAELEYAKSLLER